MPALPVCVARPDHTLTWLLVWLTHLQDFTYFVWICEFCNLFVLVTESRRSELCQYFALGTNSRWHASSCFSTFLKPEKIVLQPSLLSWLLLFFSLAPLAKKVREQQILEMTNRLCDKLLNGKEQHRDIASIALKTIVSEVPSSSIARNVLVSISPKLIKGITAPVSCSNFTVNFVHHILIGLSYYL